MQPTEPQAGNTFLREPLPHCAQGHHPSLVVNADLVTVSWSGAAPEGTHPCVSAGQTPTTLPPGFTPVQPSLGCGQACDQLLTEEGGKVEVISATGPQRLTPLTILLKRTNG